MRVKYLLLLIIPVFLFSCKKEIKVISNPVPLPLVQSTKLLLKDIMVPNLPSPYYHFEYNSDGKVKFVSFASELTRYNVMYSQGRISQMRNNILVNKDRLQYSYDDKGRVTVIKYADSTGVVFAKSSFTYKGQKLIKAERKQKVAGSFVIDRTMTMQYYADGNLKQLTNHHPAMNGQPETTVSDRYENYDSKTNVDGFSLLHPEFFEHLFLLPDVHLQINNPGREIRTGDGINYQVNYTYTYNEKNAPLTKKGDGIITNGDGSAQTFKTSSTYTYY
jgi:hypothetical protein